MNSKNSKTSEPHRLLLDCTDVINLKRSGDKYVAVSNPSIYYTWKNIKKSYKKNKFKTLNASKRGIFLIKETQSERIELLTRKQMLQRLPIGLAQVKAGNTSENLLNEIHQTIYSLY